MTSQRLLFSPLATLQNSDPTWDSFSKVFYYNANVRLWRLWLLATRLGNVQCEFCGLWLDQPQTCNDPARNTSLFQVRRVLGFGTPFVISNKKCRKQCMQRNDRCRASGEKVKGSQRHVEEKRWKFVDEQDDLLKCHAVYFRTELFVIKSNVRNHRYNRKVEVFRNYVQCFPIRYSWCSCSLIRFMSRLQQAHL